MSTTTKTQKIEIFADNSKISEEQFNIEQTKKMITDIINLWNDNDIKFSDVEINSLINSSFGEITCNKIANERSENLPRKKQLEEYTSVLEDINLFGHLYQGLRMTILSNYVYCENGKIQVKKGAMEEIKQRYTYSISTPKEIDLYERHQKLISDFNALTDDFQEQVNPFIKPLNLLRFDVDDKVILPQIKYGQ